MELDLDFYRGKKVLVTGHTGFKGTWLCKVLLYAGANVVGYSLEPEKEQILFGLSNNDKQMRSVYADIRDYEKLLKVFKEERPEIVFHLAAQPIVRESYRNPQYTYETNVMGTVNLLECIRNVDCVKSVVNVTTDKVYLNAEREDGYTEEESLNGFDPYSNSKSCSELVTSSYTKSFFENKGVAVSTARAGNVIGGGDFATARIIPDCVRAMKSKEHIVIRNPKSIRPYQHVLEPIWVYLMIAEKQYKNRAYQGCYNVGPEEVDCIETQELVQLFCAAWGEGADWIVKKEEQAPHEAKILRLDCGKLKSTFGWMPKWSIQESVEKTVEFSKVLLKKGNIEQEFEREIVEFLRG